MKNRKKKIFFCGIFLLVFLLSDNLFAQKLSFDVSKESVHAGESVDLVFNVELIGKSNDVNFSPTEEYIKKYFDIIGIEKSENKKESKVFIKRKYKCIFLLIKDVVLKPPIEVFIEKNRKICYFPEKKIKFLPLIKGKPDIRHLKDIKAPFFFTVKGENWFLWSIGICILILLIVLLLFLKRYFRKREKQIKEGTIPYWIDILRKINAMRGYEYNNFPQAKKMCYDLSMLLRKYIEKRFSILAPNKTSEEFLQELSQSKQFDDYYRMLLKNFIELSDKVKYSGYFPSKKELYKLIESAEIFVRKTMPNTEVNNNSNSQKSISVNNDRI